MIVISDLPPSSDDDASQLKSPVSPHPYLPQSDIEKIQAWIDHEQRDVLSWDSDRENDAAVCLDAIRNGILRPVSVSDFNDSPCVNEESPPTEALHSVNVDIPKEMRASERYLDPAVIGIGGFGVVVSAFDRTLGVPVALKLLRPSLGHLLQVRKRFIAEAQTTASLSHPGIIRTYELASIDSHLTISCALAAGGSLAGLRAKKSIDYWTSHQAAWFLGEIAEAVQHAHSMATLHRDLKPANVLLVPSDLETSYQLGFRPLITDFGLAKRMEFDAASAFPPSMLLHTGDGQLLGTSRYMSPEQARGDSRRVGTSSDIFSLGVILYELLTDQPPFRGNTPFEIRTQIVRGHVKRPRALRRSIPRDLEAIVLKCLETDPASRYATAHELRLDLQRFLQGEAVLASRSSWPLSCARWIRRHPILCGLAALTLTATIVAIAGLATALRVQQAANAREILWRTREQNTLRDMVSLYTDVTDQVIAGKTLEISDLLPSLERSVSLLEVAVAENPVDSKLLHRLSVLKHYLSIGQHRQANYRASIQTRQELVAILDKLAHEDPGNPKYRFDRFISLLALSDMCVWTLDGNPNFEESLQYIEQALALIESLCRDYPENLAYQDAYVAALNCMGSRLESNSPERAIQYLAAAAKRSKELWSQHPDQPELGKYAFLAPTRAAIVHLELGERDKALSLVREGMTVYRQVRYPLKDETGLLIEAIEIGSRFRSVLMSLGEKEEALAQTQVMRDVFRMLVQREMTADTRMQEITNYLTERELLLELNRPEEAADSESEMLATAKGYLEVPGFFQLLKTYQANNSIPERLATLIDEHKSTHPNE